ncbi:MAG: hypothetical protein SFX19_03720 [Alphaproteobacteria bacterium]|nr:hypothetical protein [Alphaproteobacteria bacterium]
MSTIRHFSGSRESSKHSVAKEILQLEMQKKGKLPAELRYKIIFKRKQEEAKEKALKAMNQDGFSASGKMVSQRKMSERAEHALKEMAMKKAAKEQKKLRKMVIVQPQHFSNGHIDKKGQIFDIAGNMVGKVNTKNGAMSLNSGWSIGKYKPKSYMTKLLIEQAINKHSPYFIKQRLMQAQQASLSNVHGMFTDPNVVNVQGVSAQAAMHGGGIYGGAAHGDYGVHGYDEHLHQSGFPQNFNVTAWGAVSNNAWGTFSNNVHGTLADNVHGTMNTDVWGGAGSSGMWGQRGVRMLGTGSGANHLTGITKWILGLFGYQSKAAREALRQSRALRAAGVGGGGGGAPVIRGGRR